MSLSNMIKSSLAGIETRSVNLFTEKKGEKGVFFYQKHYKFFKCE